MATRKLLIKRRPLLGQPSGWPAYVPAVMQSIYAARGVLDPSGVEQRLARLHSPSGLGGIEKAAQLLGDAIVANKRIMIAGDYDCDGATGSATAIRGLKLLGATNVDFIVPNRFKHGYGLSEGLIDDMIPTPDLVVTVDSGTSNVDGVAHAKAKGMSVIITDHHLPGDTLPDADAIVNPNLRDDPFPSKAMAGVGVMFYTLLKTRAYLLAKGVFGDNPPDLGPLLDLVALGTIADLVPLDHNNRILVETGLRQIREGKACIGLKALIASCERIDPNRLVASDIAFTIAPRLNAAGRLEDMRLGVQVLISEDPEAAAKGSKQLNEINTERREIQADMTADAEGMVSEAGAGDAWGVVVFDPKWHSGVVGLVASKLKETLYRPVIALAPAEEGSKEVRGSARSIPGFHLRDALAAVDARYPGLMKKFGGHAMAAGLSLDIAKVETFKKAFDEIAREMLTEELLDAVVFTDGELPQGFLNMQFARYIRDCGPWGQAFPEPVFENTFFVQEWKIIGQDGKHLKLSLVDPRDGTYVNAIYFNGYDPNWEPQEYVRVVYELSINSFNGNDSIQLLVRHMEPIQNEQQPKSVHVIKYDY